MSQEIMKLIGPSNLVLTPFSASSPSPLPLSGLMSDFPLSGTLPSPTTSSKPPATHSSVLNSGTGTLAPYFSSSCPFEFHLCFCLCRVLFWGRLASLTSVPQCKWDHFQGS